MYEANLLPDPPVTPASSRGPASPDGAEKKRDPGARPG